MIEFRQKEFAEHDAMRSLYVELMRDESWRRRVKVIDTNSLIPTLRGNNIVIERFVITTNRPFKKDRFRMYIKVGARAKMPDSVRLPGRSESNKLWGSSISIKPGSIFRQKNNSEILEEKRFDNNQKNNQQNNQQNNQKKDKKNKDNGGDKLLEPRIDDFRAEIRYDTMKLKGDTIEYNKQDRSLVIEYDTIRDAIESLNILPFGLNYNIYLLDV